MEKVPSQEEHLILRIDYLEDSKERLKTSLLQLLFAMPLLDLLPQQILLKRILLEIELQM